MKNYNSENGSEFIRWASKIEHEKNGHLENFSCPQGPQSEVTGNSRQHLHLRIMCYGKPSLDAPDSSSYSQVCDIALIYCNA